MSVIGWIGIVSVFLSIVQCHSDVSLIGGASNLVTDRPLDLPISERQGPGETPGEMCETFERIGIRVSS